MSTQLMFSWPIQGVSVKDWADEMPCVVGLVSWPAEYSMSDYCPTNVMDDSSSVKISRQRVEIERDRVNLSLGATKYKWRTKQNELWPAVKRSCWGMILKFDRSTEARSAIFCRSNVSGWSLRIWNGNTQDRLKPNRTVVSRFVLWLFNPVQGAAGLRWKPSLGDARIEYKIKQSQNKESCETWWTFVK